MKLEATCERWLPDVVPRSAHSVTRWRARRESTLNPCSEGIPGLVVPSWRGREDPLVEEMGNLFSGFFCVAHRYLGAFLSTLAEGHPHVLCRVVGVLKRLLRTIR